MRVVLCTCPPERSTELARVLVERRLVACVNRLAGVQSFFRWEGTIQDEAEDLLVMKTTDEGFDRLLAALPDLHPYDVPEILALPVEAGYRPYMDWVAAEVAPEATPA